MKESGLKLLAAELAEQLQDSGIVPESLYRYL
jgi:hypothetical protein